MEKREEACTQQTTDNTSPDSYCGIGPCQPLVLQRFRNILSFSLFYGLTSVITQTLLVYIVSQITALEKQFNLDSTTAGVIVSCNDIGFLCMITFISYFGRERHIPRILTASTYLMGFAGLLASLGYFIDPIYLPKLADGTIGNASVQNEFVAPLCGKDNDSDVEKCNDTSDSSTSAGSQTWPIWLFCISMLLQGIGRSPRVALSTTYIDNNNSVKTKTGLHVGIIATMNIIGRALALALGGLFRSVPVDLQDTDLTPTHPKWIGAWWMGFLAFGCLCLVIGIPLLFFPQHILPVQTTQLGNKSPNSLHDIKDLPRSVLRVFRKKLFTLTLIATVIMMFVSSGVQSFRPKYVEKQFMVPAYKTNIILGLAGIISATIGTFSGGLLTSRLKLTRLGNLRIAILGTSLSLSCGILGFFLGCETPHLYGFHDHKGKSKLDNDLSECSCDANNFFPVCGEDGMTYFSPCFAGCTNQTLSMYGGCSEVPGGKTTAGICETDCPYLYYYITVDALQLLFGTIIIMPLFMTTLRSVEEKDKTLAVALIQFFMPLLGLLPAPILFGYVIDTACILWGYQCGIKGACAQYDLESLRFRLKLMECGAIGLTILFLIVSYVVLKIERGDKAVTGTDSLKAKEVETSRL